MKISAVEQKIIEEAKANNGSVKLDFRKAIHYQYFTESFGGEAHIRNHAPDVYRQLKRQQAAPPSPCTNSAPKAPKEDSVIHLRTYERLEIPAITILDKGPGNDNWSASLSCTLRLSHAEDNLTNANCRFRVLDERMGNVILDKTYEDLVPDQHGEFAQTLEQPIIVENGNLENTYTFIAAFTAISTSDSGDASLSSHVIVSPYIAGNSEKKLKQVELTHPINHNSTKRDKNYQNLICVSYKRDSNLRAPDYSYDLKTINQSKPLPVYLPIGLRVQLKDGACFECVDGSYFSYGSDPTFAVKNMDDQHNNPIATGEAVFLGDWKNFCRNYVTVKTNQQTGLDDTLEISFGINQDARWPMDLKFPVPGRLWNVSTYACFYAYIIFNIKYDGGLHPLPVIIQYDKNKPISYISEPEENSLYIHRLFYQWGCLAKDASLQSPTGPIAAQDVQIGDFLLTREGTYRAVRDVITGPSQTIRQIGLSCGYTIRLTKDHTLCRADGEPVTASNVHTGDTLQIFRTETMTPDTSQVISIEELTYEDMVYNFIFDEPTFIVADGVVAGDHDYQQKMRPSSLSAYHLPEPNEKTRLFISQLNQLRRTSSSPVFVESDAHTTALFYYCALKCILTATNLYSEDEAQEIAEFCAFLESNATYGALSVDGQIEGKYLSELHKRGLAVWGGDYRRYIKLIPTAMQTWYDHDELKATQTWTAPSAPSEQSPSSFTFCVKKDILVPFHYPVEDKTAPAPESIPKTVKYKPAFIKDILKDIVAKSKLPQAEAPSPTALRMGIGIALHLLIDTKLHDGYSGYSSWYNLRRTQNIVDRDRNDLTTVYPAYHDYADKAFDANAEYPAGIEQTGPCVDIPFVKFNYKYPFDTAQLINHNTYTDQRTFDNSFGLCDVLYEVASYLYYYKQGEYISENDHKWTKIRDPLLKVLSTPYTSATDFLNQWKSAFPYVTLNYDPQKIFDSMAPENADDYEKLSQYTLILNQVQQGKQLYD